MISVKVEPVRELFFAFSLLLELLHHHLHVDVEEGGADRGALVDSVREVELLVPHHEVQVQVQDSQELYLILREDLLPDHILV